MHEEARCALLSVRGSLSDSDIRESLLGPIYFALLFAICLLMSALITRRNSSFNY